MKHTKIPDVAPIVRYTGNGLQTTRQGKAKKRLAVLKKIIEERKLKR